MPRPFASFALLCAALAAPSPFTQAARAEIALPDVPAPSPAPAPAGAPGAPGAPAKAAPAAPAFADRLLFADKDSLRGTFVSYAGGSLTWRHKDGAAPFQFKSDHLDCLELGASAAKADPAVDLRIAFNNGDTLYGKLVEFTPEKTVVDTWYAGRLTIASDLIRSLAPCKNTAGALVSGFGKVADWKAENGTPQNIKIADGRMTLTNSVWAARELPMPAKFKLDIEMPQSQPAFQFAMLADGVQIWGGNCYMIQCNGNNGWIHKYTRQANGGNRQEGVGNFRFKAADGKCAITVLGDLEAKTMVVLINGQKVSTITLAADFTPGKHLVLSGQNGNLTLSKLELTPWTGSLDAALGGEAKRLPADAMVLANKDQMSGQLLGIKDGKATFKAEFASMEVPLDRIQRFDLSAKFNRAQKPGKGEVQMFFNETDHLTLGLDAIGDGKLTGHSEALGAACAIDLGAAKKLLFNLDAPFRKERAEQARNNPGDDE